MIELTTILQLKNLLEEKDDTHLYLFKHSTRCPTSSVAFAEFERFSKKHPSVTCAIIKVIENRDVSDLLTEISEQTHQSPQVIVYFCGEIVWAGSHMAIHENNLKSQIKPES